MCYYEVAITASDNISKVSQVSTETSEYSNGQLTDIAIAYGLYCGMYDAFKLLESNPANPLIKLDRNINMLPGGISTGLAFPHRTFIVQNNIKGNVYGFGKIKGKPSAISMENILFVTTPIESFRGRILKCPVSNRSLHLKSFS